MTTYECCPACEDGELWADVQFRRGLDEHGWMIQQVLSDDQHPGFAYTVGLTKWLLPEVLVYDLDPAHSGLVLNVLANRLIAGEDIPDGAHLHDLDPRGHCFRLFSVLGESAPVYSALNLYGPTVRVHQLITPDAQGRLPWQRHYTGLRQPLHFTPPRE